MNWTRLTRLVAVAELPVVLAIAPALLFPTPARLVVLAVVPVIWLCARIASGHIVPRTPMNAALWLMLAMVGVSLSATFDIRFSLGKVSGVMLGALLFWAIVRWLGTPDRLKVGVAAFLLAGAGLAAVALLGTNRLGKVSALGVVIARLPMAIRQVPGAEEGFNPNAVAGCLVLFVPLQVALLTMDIRRWLFPLARSRWAARCLVALQAVLLFLTAGTVVLMQSRSAWLGLAAAAVAFLLWHGRRTRVLAVVAAGAVVVLGLTFGVESLFSQAVSRSRPDLAGTVSGRVELWSRAIYGIQDFPFTGMGMNAFRELMPVLYPALLTSPGADVAHAHNHLLQAALDLGIPGLVAYGSLWLVSGALLVSVFRRSRARVYRLIAGGLGAGLVAHFMFGMTDAIPLGSKVGILFWLTLALTVAFHRVASGRQPDWN